MKMRNVLVAFACIPSLAMAQQYDVRKGKVTVDKNVIATYDGKGSILRLFDLTVSSPGKKPLISVKEKFFDFKNPLRRDGVRWAEITFLDGTAKKMNFHFPKDNRPQERDLIGFLFKDSSSALVEGEGLNATAVDAYIKANNFDWIADSQYVRQVEKDNKARVLEPLDRDKSKSFEIRQIASSTGMKNGGNLYNTTFEIFQDGVLIGKIDKEVIKTMSFGSTAYYVIWKRTTSPYTFEGKEMKFGLLAYLNTTGPTFDQELILMTDKSVVKFKTTDHTTAEYKIIDLLITNQIL